MPIVSIRVVVILLLFVVAFAIALVTLIPLNTSAATAVNAAIAGLRRETTFRIVGQVQSSFNSVVGPIQSLALVLALGRYRALVTVDLDILDLLPLVAPIVNQTGGSTVYLGVETGDWFGCTPQSVWWRNRTAARAFTYGYDMSNSSVGGLRVNLSNVKSSFNYDPRTRPWYKSLVTKTSVSWTLLYVTSGGNGADCTVGSPIVQDNRVVGALALDYSTSSVAQLLANVRLSPNTKVFVAETATGAMLGASFTYAITTTVNGTTRLTVVDELTDPLVAYVMGSLPSKFATLQQQQLPSASTLYSTSAEVPTSLFPPIEGGALAAGAKVTTFLDMAAIRDAYGLDLRVVLLVPDVDFNREFRQASNIAIILSVVILVVALAIATLAAIRLLQPLSDLAELMEVTQSLNTGEGQAAVLAPEQLSSLAEVRTIQMKFVELISQLRRVCSFLPQAVVEQLAGRADMDDEEVMELAHRRVPGSGKSASGKSASGKSADLRSHGRSSTTGKSRRESITPEVSVMSSFASAFMLSTRPVTLLVVNVRGFQAIVSSSTSSTVSSLLSDFTAALTTVAATCAGSLHSIHGDHAVLSFNAVKNCTSHAEKAVIAAIKLTDRMHQHRTTLTIGIASGVALCGQAGDDSVKHFAVIGTVYRRAAMLERLCKRYPLAVWPTAPADMLLAPLPALLPVMCLLDRVTASEAENNFFVRAVDLIPSPDGANTKPMVVSTFHDLIGPELLGSLALSQLPVKPPAGETTKAGVGKSGGDTEWMYVLEEAGLKHPSRVINEVFNYAQRLAAYHQLAGQGAAPPVVPTLFGEDDPLSEHIMDFIEKHTPNVAPGAVAHALSRFRQLRDQKQLQDKAAFEECVGQYYTAAFA